MPNPLIKSGAINPGDFLLPDGRNPNDLRLSQLHTALVALKIPNVRSDMGKHLLLGAYHAHVVALVQAMPRARSLPNHVIPDSDARQVIAQLGKDAA